MTNPARSGRPPSFAAERLYAALAVSPVWVGLGISAALLGLLLLLTWLTGGLELFLTQELPADPGLYGARSRNARLAISLALLAGFLPTARRYAVLGARDNLTELRAHLASPARADSIWGLDASRTRAPWWAGLLGLLLVPVVALSIDRDPTFYFQPDYWREVTVWIWSLGAFCCWNVGAFLHGIVAASRDFSRLAAALRPLDLLDLRALRPFSRQGLRSALLCVLLFSILALPGLRDPGFLAAGLVTLLVVAAVSVTALVLPVRGAHARIRRAKSDELDRVNAAIRGAPGALAGSAIESRAANAGLADLLAYRAAIETVREWPFDAPTVLRFALYLAIPLGSWLGGALVERGLEALLD